MVFARVLRKQVTERARREEQMRKLMDSRASDAHAQHLIETDIRRRNIEANKAAAMEYRPETFGNVDMLYIKCRLNGYEVLACVDSGEHLIMGTHVLMMFVSRFLRVTFYLQGN